MGCWPCVADFGSFPDRRWLPPPLHYTWKCAPGMSGGSREGQCHLKSLRGGKTLRIISGREFARCSATSGKWGLPVHRPAGAVVAVQAELTDWVSRGSSQADSVPKRQALQTRTNKLRANFLQIDSEIALTFSSMALETRNPEKRKRTTWSARKAYDTIMQFRENTDLSDQQRGKLETNLRRLKNELQRLGQSV